MNRIEAIFRDLRSDGARALMPFVCAGRPTPAALAPLLLSMERAGAAIVEIGFPFSDPIADGPVIAAAMHEALESHTTLEHVFEGVAEARREGLSIGLVAMVSVSIVQRVGVDAFVTRAREAGFDGFIFPDAPIEESDALLASARDAGMTASLLIAPTSPEDRATRIAQACTGFVYLLARVGITGERSDAPDVADRVARLRAVTDLPIACGFGVGTPEHVRAVVEHADAAIVGSALVGRMEDSLSAGEDPIAAGEEFVTQLAGGLTLPR